MPYPLVFQSGQGGAGDRFGYAFQCGGMVFSR